MDIKCIKAIETITHPSCSFTFHSFYSHPLIELCIMIHRKILFKNEDLINPPEQSILWWPSAVNVAKLIFILVSVKSDFTDKSGPFLLFEIDPQLF